MGESWSEECKEFLKQIKESAETEDPDRLELVRSMHTALLAINHSTLGWFQYVNNPEVMNTFDRKELNEILITLNELAEAYLLHDIEVTEKSLHKGLSRMKGDKAPDHLYV
ncbi:MAG: DUF2153 family protein [Candidatus Bathyarchaeota archaeon]|jgi:hypothetical protein